MIRSFACAAIFLTTIALSAAAQFTPKQIDSLRRVGELEGWTFTISDTPLVSGSLENLCGFVEPDQTYQAPLSAAPAISIEDITFPARFDWRDTTALPPVRDQGDCGSCWAFATVGPLECNIAIKDGLVIDLSEQYLVSCNEDGWNCEIGGIWEHNYHLTLAHPDCRTDPCGGYGPILESDFPYEAADLTCECPYIHQRQFALQDWGFVSYDWLRTIPTVEEIKRAIMLYGPIYVSVRVTNPFWYYSGGIFNACDDDYTNHAVVLVGWDDNQGTEGIWYLRNSWGTAWGENGYIRIEYNCSRVGNYANWVDYGLPRVILWADTTYGWVPFTANFNALAMDSVATWTWDFGDGGSASGQTATHTFTEAGAYDITVQADCYGTIRTAAQSTYILAIADTIKATPVEAEPESQVVVTITANNSTPLEYLKIPVEFAGELDLRFDSCSTVGCRTEYFERQDYVNYDLWYNKRFTLRLVSSDHDTSPDLSPGTGPVAKVYFTVPETAAEGQSAAIVFDGYDIYQPTFTGDLAAYQVATVSGSVTVAGCCVNRGDADHDGAVEIDDIIYLIEWTFSGGPPPPCLAEADADGIGPVTIDDLVDLVNYIYKAGPTPTPCR